ncbi:MAG: F0F1 ATP synthase subunit epsilon [Defluviitaleaceae bacterium]|nr:F0F1 ATP synthase subunit epsilon [Defluviitaleaceae bacterium]
MEKKLTIKIVSPGQPTDKRIPTQADMVIMRSTAGDLGVLPGRAPVSLALCNGIMRIMNGEVEARLLIDGGLASVNQNVITVLTESAVLQE